MTAKPCHNMALSQFTISKNVYNSGILSQIKLTMSAKLVLIALTNHYNPEKPDIFPSQQYIAEHLGISIKSVNRAIHELTQAGLIMYETKNVNRYKFTAKFFAEIKMSVNYRQSDNQSMDKMTMKQIKEKKNNNKVLNFSKNNEGMKYKSPETTQNELRESLGVRDDKTPYNDKETAFKYILACQNMIHVDIVRKKVEEVKKIWGIC